MKFDKPAYTPDQHIELLESRGMTLVDHDRAKRYLTTIGYYRLSAYFLPFLAEKDQFKTDVKFSDILDLYIFDRKLRLHVMDALERIEVAIQSSKSFSFNTNDFSGWLHALTLIRNNCAHHGRFWNSTFPPKAKNIAKYTHKYIPIDTPYANLALIHAFLTSFTNQPTWSQKLFDLLQDCPLDINHNMKFPFDWDQFPFWCIHT
jgi:abortive infection bacteriophage resistance protein